MAALRTGSSRWSIRRTYQAWRSRGIVCGRAGGRRRYRICFRGRDRRCDAVRRIWRNGRWRRRFLELIAPSDYGGKATPCRGPPRTGSVAGLVRPSTIHVCHLWRTANVCGLAGGKGATVTGLTFSCRAPRPCTSLLAIVRKATNYRARVLAAQALAYLAADVRDQELANAVLQDLDSRFEKVIDEDIASQCSLARVLLLKLTGQAAKSEDLVRDTIDKLRRSGTTNLVTIKLFGALGTLNTCEGRMARR